MLTRDEVVDLLTAISAYDNRKPNPAAILAWGKAAELGRWTLAEALDAVHQHFLEDIDYLMPAHVGNRIRAARQDRAMRQEAEQLTGLANPHVLEALKDFADARAIPGPTPQRRAELIEAVTGALPAPRGNAESTLSAEQIRQAKRVPCPWCQARPFHECSRPSPRGDRRMVVPHPARVEAAEAAFGGVA